MLHRIDACYANLTSTLPRFALEDPPTHLAQRSESMDVNDNVGKVPTVNDSLEAIKIDGVSEIMKELCSLSTLTSCRRLGWSNGIFKKPTIIHDRALKLELQAISLSYRLSRTRQYHKYDILSSFHVAMNIYIYVAVRTIPMGCSCLDLMALNLKVELEALGYGRGHFQYPPDLWLWVLFMGGIVSTTARSWFCSRILEASRAQEIQCWENARDILKKFPLVVLERFDCESHCKGLWEELNVF